MLSKKELSKESSKESCKNSAHRQTPWHAGFPYATTGLVLTTIAVYLILSEGALYAPSLALQQVSFQQTNPLTALTHVFAHIGAIHLIGNLIPLIVFSLVLELAFLPQEVLLVFFASGIISALVFSALNPGTALIGGSAAIAGLAGAAVLTKPKWSALAFLLLPIVMGYAVMPAAQFLTTQHATQLVKETQAIKQEVTSLVQENRTEEAKELNKTLVIVEKKAEVVAKGIEREQRTPTEIPVHFYGFFVGVAYALFFKRGEVKRGGRELLAIKKYIAEIIRRVR